MSSITIFPSSSQPLVIVLKNSRNQLHAKKFWHVVLNEDPYKRIEEIWSSSCQFSKSHTLNEVDFKWTDPKPITPPRTTVALIQYNPTSNSCLTPSMRSLAKVNMASQLLQPLQEYHKFILNQEHKFSYLQTRAIYLQLQSWLHNEMPQFLQLWPYANKETPPPFTIPQITFPLTIKDALKLIDDPLPIQSQPPKLFFIQQPISLPIPIPNLRATNFHSANHKQFSADCNVILHVTPEGKQNRRREVFYAQPINTPTDLPIPISPLKSTVAIMYADGNPKSETFNQPIIKSINTNASTKEEIAKFLYTQINEHGATLSEDQLQALANPVKLPTIRADFNQPHQEPTMQTQQCVHCGKDFMPTRSFNKYCSPECRVIANTKHRDLHSIKRIQKEQLSQMPFYGIKFPDEQFYMGPTYTEDAQIHDAEQRAAPWHAKRYSEATANNLIAQFPKIFAGCIVEKLLDY